MIEDWVKEFEKECAGIEKDEICPRCGRKALVRVAEWDYIFACTSCGARFEFDGRYKDELDYALARKQ